MALINLMKPHYCHLTIIVKPIIITLKSANDVYNIKRYIKGKHFIAINIISSRDNEILCDARLL